MKTLRIALKAVAVVTVVLAVLVGAAAVALNSSTVQNRMMGYATGMLRERLGTQVEIDSVHVNFLTQKAVLTGLRVEDREQRDMLRLRSLAVHFSLWDLLSRTVTISNVEVGGLHARLYKAPGEPANYQFVVDAFKKDPAGAKADTLPRDTARTPGLQLDIRKVRLEDVDVSYNDDDRATIGRLTVDRRRKRWDVGLDELHFRHDSPRPRKNEGKPTRGSFDAGHLDLTATLRLTVDHVAKDTVHAELTQCAIADTTAGINLRDLRLKAALGGRTVHLADVTIQQENTTLQFAEGRLRLPDKRTGEPLAYSTSDITAHVVLKDIARPFAPVLGQFTMPLNLNVRLAGTDDGMTFSDIRVATDDKRLTIAASGSIAHLKDNARMAIRFHVANMTAKGNVKRDVINQFAVKKFMMKQLDALGTIRYTGDVVIKGRRETFTGRLGTAAGSLGVNVALDGATQYVAGDVSTTDLQLGRVFDIPDIGRIDGSATFKFDYSVERTKRMRRQHGGKLPIGSVKATIREAHYKKLTVRDIYATIESNGARAQGNIKQKNKHVDLLCDFSFDNTDAMRKMKVKPSVKVNTFEQLGKRIAEKKAEKVQKKAEKAQKKAEKKAQKEARKQKTA